MDPKVISDDLQRFIVEKIDSVGQLEALLLLRKEPAKYWSVYSLAKRLYISQDQTAEILRKLCSDGLVTRNDAEPSEYRYNPRQELVAFVDRLAEAYSKHLVPVTNMIHSKSRIQKFADAFRLRRDE